MHRGSLSRWFVKCAALTTVGACALGSGLGVVRAGAAAPTPPTQPFTTILTGGEYGEGLQARLASLRDTGTGPAGIVVASDGTVYISDTAHDEVRSIDASGVIHRVAGWVQGSGGDGGPAHDAGLNGPAGIALDDAGDLYIADQNNDRVRRVDHATGSITTVAGTGTRGFAGDGGAATQAQLSRPGGVAVASDGTLYIADTGNARIRRVDPSGTITTYAGDGSTGVATDGVPATASTIPEPDGVALDTEGDLFISDARDCTVREVLASNGFITAFAGTSGSCGAGGDGGPATSAKLRQPSGVAVDSAGDVFIADYSNYTVRRVDSAGTITTVAGTGSPGCTGADGAATQTSMVPQSVAVDATGNLYIASACGRTYRVSAGNLTWIAGNGILDTAFSGAPAAAVNFAGPIQTAVWGPDGRPYFAAGDSIWTIDAGGILRLVAGNGDELHPGDADGPALSALFSSDIASLAFDAGGDLFIADHGNLKIKELAGGIVTTVAGAANGAQGDGPALQVQVLPFGLTVQADGTVVFTEWNRPGLVRTLHNGMVTTIAGGPVGTNGAFYGPDGVPSTQTHLDFPLGISSGPDGSVYFADNANNRVRRIAPDSIVSTVAGDGGGTYRGDGNLAVLASFPSPDGVSVDGAGNLFVSETNDIEFDNYISYPTDYVIRQVSRHGMVTLIAGTGQQGQGPSGPSLSSPLLDPLGISAGAGGLLVADRTTLRLITPPSTGWPDPAVSVTCDPFDIGVVGDAYASTASVNGQANRPWLDVVQGNVTSDGSTLTATITVDNLLAIGQGPPVNTLGQANAWMYYFETDDWKYHYLLALAPLSTQDPYSPGQVSFEYGTAVQETEDLYFIDRQGIATGSFDTSANTVTLNKDLRSLGVQPGQQIIEQHYDGGELLEGAPVQTRSVEADDLDGTSRSYTVGKNCPEAFVNGPGTATPEATTFLLPIAGGLGGAVAVMRRRHRRGDREKATEAEA